MVPPGIVPVMAQEQALRLKRGGGLHAARPYCWRPTKRPGTTPGGLTAASVMIVSGQEGVRPPLRTSPSSGRTLGVHWTS